MERFFDDGCGGFGFFQSMEKLAETYEVSQVALESWQGSYNIRPRAFAPIIRQKDGQREAVLGRFGLVPSWFRGDPSKAGWINARSETVEQKRAFAGSFRHHRALLPSDFFLEFALNPADPKHKVPILFKARADELLTMGAIYATWTDAEGRALNTFGILTTEANSLVARYHSRMPLLLARKDWAAWLEPESEPEALRKLLKPYPPSKMTAFRVRQEIGNARNDYPELIEPQPPIPVTPSQPAWES
ncbi:MAG: SOS response-associated peptidase [Anaerolineae bacterium]